MNEDLRWYCWAYMYPGVDEGGGPLAAAGPGAGIPCIGLGGGRGSFCGAQKEGPM